MIRIRYCSMIALLHLALICTCLAFTRDKASYELPAKLSSNSISQSIPQPTHSRPSFVSPLHYPSVKKAASTALSAEALSNSSFRSRVLGGLKDRLRRKPNVEVVEDVNEFLSIVDNERQHFIAVMFHAPFCKACKAAAPHFFKMAKKYSNVKFVSVPLTESNANNLKGLGISKFPFAHIYDPEKGLVDELPVLRKLVPQFEEKLRSYVTQDERDDDN